jgi:hypothetical protein
VAPSASAAAAPSASAPAQAIQSSSKATTISP